MDYYYGVNSIDGNMDTGTNNIKSHFLLQPGQKQSVTLLGLLFAASFFLRSYHSAPRPNQWYDRSGAFKDAIISNNLEETYQSYHPGVPTMAIGGLSLHLFDSVRETPFEVLFSWATPSYATKKGREMSAILIGQAVCLSLLIIMICFTLKQLGGWWLGLTGAALVIFSPVHIASSRMVHIDAFSSLFLVLSSLQLLVSMETGKRRYLLLSGFSGGLAFLARVTGIFLIPFLGLTLLVYLAKQFQVQRNNVLMNASQWLLVNGWKGFILPGLLCVLGMLLALTLWPAMWLDPVAVLSKAMLKAGRHIETAHSKTHFFLGMVYKGERPAFYFYPVALLVNSTGVTSILSLLAIGQYTIWRKQVKPLVSAAVFWLMVSFIIFFIIQMTIGAKQGFRYILPAQVMLTLLAAVGLIGILSHFRRDNRTKRENLAVVILLLSIPLQVVTTFSNALDFDMHHNYLLGGSRTAVNVIEVMREGEGGATVIDYLHNKLDGETPEIATIYPFNYTMSLVYNADKLKGLGNNHAAYYVVSYSAIQRQRKVKQVTARLQSFEETNHKPELILTYDGIPMVWVYAADNLSPTTKIIKRGGMIYTPHSPYGTPRMLA